jgi:hypothetical protein
MDSCYRLSNPLPKVCILFCVSWSRGYARWAQEAASAWNIADATVSRNRPSRARLKLECSSDQLRGWPVWGSVRQASSGSDKAEMRETRFKIIELVQKEYQRTIVCWFTITFFRLVVEPVANTNFGLQGTASSVLLHPELQYCVSKSINCYGK